MDPILLILLLVGVGVVLLIGEALLPTHGIVGAAGVLCFIGAIGVCFYINRWLGLGVSVAAVALSPFLVSGFIHVWKRSRIGRRIIMPPIESTLPPPEVHIGQTGVAFSELRPMGECDFGDRRVEALSEHGLIKPGTKVKVVAFTNGKATVRAIDASA
jgi:membrane-bound serine protease (ClpP class)